MPKALTIIVLGLLVAVGAFCGVYLRSASQQRAVMRTNTPELYWLKKEFNLSEEEFQRISELHRSYMPSCQEMCRQIDQNNLALQKLLATNSTMTPELSQALDTSARLRAECQKRMLSHFHEVARTMPPEQGKRYLAWVQERTIMPASDMTAHH